MYINQAIEMAKRLMVDSIWKSANLEGLGTTFPKTEMILENIPVDTSKEEVLFIVNMKRAWQFLIDNIEYRNCLAFLRELNKLVGLGIFYGAGEIRKLPVSIGGTNWIPDTPQEGVLYDTISELEGVEDVELRALKYFCFIARTQMFIDGNKRVAQLMANKVLIENGIGIFQIPIEAIETFKKLLIAFYESNSDAQIISFMQEYCIKRVGEVPKVYKNSIKTTKFEYTGSSRNFVLSGSQVEILDCVLKSLIKLLKSYGLSGEWVLCDCKGYVKLYGSEGSCLVDVDKIKTEGVFEGEDDSLLLEFIVKTVMLLNDKVPLDIKKLSFSLDGCLSTGFIRSSREEEGSLEIRLI